MLNIYNSFAQGERSVDPENNRDVIAATFHGFSGNLTFDPFVILNLLSVCLFVCIHYSVVCKPSELGFIFRGSLILNWHIFIMTQEQTGWPHVKHIVRPLRPSPKQLDPSSNKLPKTGLHSFSRCQTLFNLLTPACPLKLVMDATQTNLWAS